MTSILFLVFSILLLTESCTPARSGNKMIAFKPERHSKRYSSDKPPTRYISGYVKNDVNGGSIDQASVAIYFEDRIIEPLETTMTTLRGRFSFNVVDGYYTIVITHQKFKEKRLFVSVEGFNLELNDIRLEQFFD